MNRALAIKQIHTIRMSLHGTADFADRDLIALVKALGADRDLAAVKKRAVELALEDTAAQEEIAAMVGGIDARTDHQYLAILLEAGRMMEESTARWLANRERLEQQGYPEPADGTFTMVEDTEPAVYGEIPSNGTVVLRYRTRRVAVRRDSFYSALKRAAYRFLRVR